MSKMVMNRPLFTYAYGIVMAIVSLYVHLFIYFGMERAEEIWPDLPIVLGLAIMGLATIGVLWFAKCRPTEATIVGICGWILFLVINSVVLISAW